MREILMSTVVGFVVGVLFASFRLPIPAPPVLSGVMGIVGIFLGYKLVSLIFGW